MTETKYFWLKLKKKFFDTPKIKLLREEKNGDTYVLIYQKMMLLSLDTDGKLLFEELKENFIDELSLKLDEKK